MSVGEKKERGGGGVEGRSEWQSPKGDERRRAAAEL